MTDVSERIDLDKLDELRTLAKERQCDLTQLVPTVTMTAGAVLALIERAEFAERRLKEALNHDPLHGANEGVHCGGMAPCIRRILSEGDEQ